MEEVIGYCGCAKGWCIQHRRHLSFAPALIGIGLAGFTYHLSPAWGMPVAIWVVAVVAPIVLGMLEYVRFRWVLLWELLMFLPIAIIVAVFFGGAIIGVLKKRGG